MAKINSLLNIHTESYSSSTSVQDTSSIYRVLMVLESAGAEVVELEESVNDLIDKKEVVEEVAKQQEENIEKMDTSSEVTPEEIENNLISEQQVLEGQISGLGIPSSVETTATESFFRDFQLRSTYVNLPKIRTESYVNKSSFDRTAKMKELYKINHEGFMETVKELGDRILAGIKELYSKLITFIKEFLAFDYKKHVNSISKSLVMFQSNPDDYVITSALQDYKTCDGVGATLCIQNFDTVISNFMTSSSIKVDKPENSSASFNCSPLDLVGIETSEDKYKNYFLPVDDGLLGADHGGMMRVAIVKPTKVKTGVNSMESAIKLVENLLNVITTINPTVRKGLQENVKSLEKLIAMRDQTDQPIHDLHKEWYTTLVTGVVQSVGTIHKTVDFVLANIVKKL